MAAQPAQSLRRGRRRGAAAAARVGRTLVYRGQASVVRGGSGWMHMWYDRACVCECVWGEGDVEMWQYGMGVWQAAGRLQRRPPRRGPSRPPPPAEGLPHLLQQLGFLQQLLKGRARLLCNFQPGLQWVGWGGGSGMGRWAAGRAAVATQQPRERSSASQPLTALSGAKKVSWVLGSLNRAVRPAAYDRVCQGGDGLWVRSGACQRSRRAACGRACCSREWPLACAGAPLPHACARLPSLDPHLNGPEQIGVVQPVDAVEQGPPVQARALRVPLRVPRLVHGPVAGVHGCGASGRAGRRGRRAGRRRLLATGGAERGATATRYMQCAGHAMRGSVPGVGAGMRADAGSTDLCQPPQCSPAARAAHLPSPDMVVVQDLLRGLLQWPARHCHGPPMLTVGRAEQQQAAERELPHGGCRV